MAQRKNRRSDRLEAKVIDEAALAGVGNRHRRQQRQCIGVLRIFKDRSARPNFNDAAKIHDTDMMRHPFHHRHIMADEQVGQAQIFLQLHHQVQNLRLHRHIERRDRLIRHDQLGVDGQSAGDGHPLALPAGQLMRKAAHKVTGQADPVKDFRHPVVQRLPPEKTKVQDRFGHLIF